MPRFRGWADIFRDALFSIDHSIPLTLVRAHNMLHTFCHPITRRCMMMQQGDQILATCPCIIVTICCVQTLRMFAGTLSGAEKVTEMNVNRPAVIYDKKSISFSTENNNTCFYFYYTTQLLTL